VIKCYFRNIIAIFTAKDLESKESEYIGRFSAKFCTIYSEVRFYPIVLEKVFGLEASFSTLFWGFGEITRDLGFSKFCALTKISANWNMNKIATSNSGAFPMKWSRVWIYAFNSNQAQFRGTKPGLVIKG
jgi:hypothetical protein